MRDIPGYEGKYAITEDGNVWSHHRQMYKKTAYDKDGYLVVMFSVNGRSVKRRVHRLVAMTYLGLAENDCREVNHKDEVKTNNNVSNLEILSREEHVEKSRHCFSTTRKGGIKLTYAQRKQQTAAIY